MVYCLVLLSPAIKLIMFASALQFVSNLLDKLKNKLFQIIVQAATSLSKISLRLLRSLDVLE